MENPPSGNDPPPGEHHYPPSSALLDNHSKVSAKHSNERTLRYCCYGLHVFLILIHVVLATMLFSHLEHRVTIAANNTMSPVALSAFLQAFYTIYTALLVLLVRRLAISATMAKRQKLTAVHDILGAWNGIGASIGTLWRQIKVASSPLALILILGYLAGISGLHIVSSSVIQFEPFNNTITQVVPSIVAWPSPSVNLSAINWQAISPSASVWPIFSSTKGWTKNVLYDVPSSDYPYTGALVNATTISAHCGLLSNDSVGTYVAVNQTFNVGINGLGPVGLPVGVGLSRTVNYFDWDFVYYNNLASCPLCGNYIPFEITTELDLGNLTGHVLQANTNVTFYTPDSRSITSQITSSYAACFLNATRTQTFLAMQDGVASLDDFSANTNDLLPWIVWTPESTTELTAMFQSAEHGAAQMFYYCDQAQQCNVLTSADIFLNSLLNISLASAFSNTTMESTQSLILERQQLEDAIAEVAAMYIWLAGEFGASGGFQHDMGESWITNIILEQRLHVNTTPVVIGLIASTSLLTIIVWLLHESHGSSFKSSVTDAGVLELLWISAHSSSLQDLMKNIQSSSLDELRKMGMEVDICLADLDFGSIEYQGDATTILPSNFSVYRSDKYDLAKDQLSTYWWCYPLHSIFLVLHVILMILLKYHPEHNIVMTFNSTWTTITLSLFLQAFYVLYTAALLFVTQQLALCKTLGQRHHLTGVHDIANAWPGIGTAIYTFWQQRKIVSSMWTTLGVVLYLASISVLHIISPTIMQFTAFNSTSSIYIPSELAWPDSSSLANESWTNAIQILPSSNLLANIKTNGLINNTIYSTLSTTNGDFINATVNTTSIQASCTLLWNLSYGPALPSPTSATVYYLNFSIEGLGSGSLPIEPWNLQQMVNNQNAESICSWPCPEYLAFLITTNVELDGVVNNTLGLTVNVAAEGSQPTMAYLAVCSLSTQTAQATLDVQIGNLTTMPTSSRLSTYQQSWKLWSPGTLNALNLTYGVAKLFDLNGGIQGLMLCPQHGYEICSIGESLPAQSDPLYKLHPNQLEDVIGQTAAAIIWTAGQVGSRGGGFDQIVGESQVVQVITQWQLNINTVPVILALVASALLLLLAFLLAGTPPKAIHPGSPVTGVSVLETIWLSAHSRLLRERMVDINDPSLHNLRKAGMFQIRLGDAVRPHHIRTESEHFLIE